MSEPTKEELLARIAELEKQTGGTKRSGALEFRVGEKGGVSVYGLGRFPVTLYYEQWIRLLDVSDGLRAFQMCIRDRDYNSGTVLPGLSLFTICEGEADAKSNSSVHSLLCPLECHSRAIRQTWRCVPGRET